MTTSIRLPSKSLEELGTRSETSNVMRVGLLIGALNRGGSERQLSELAVGLKERGHQVEVVSYAGRGAFDDCVEANGVMVNRCGGHSKWSKIQAVAEWKRSFRPQIMHGFMKRASMLAVLTNLAGPRSRVVASDFSTASYSRHKPILWAALAIFGEADAVVTQTEMNRKNLERLAPWLRRKTIVVRNGADLERFRPLSTPRQDSVFRFVCVSSVYRVKNPIRVVQAVRILRDRAMPPFRVDWYGRFTFGPAGAPSADYLKGLELVQRNRLEEVLSFHGELGRVEEAYHNADALVHASIQEGIPNAVIEAMACGLPLVVSRVSDLPLIVSEGRNGFVFDETNPAAIADAMEQMLKTSESEREQMAKRSRDLAERWFGRDRFISEYETLYRSLLSKQRIGA